MELVGLAYDAAVRPEVWGTFFERLSDAMGAEASGVFCFDRNVDRVVFDAEVRVDPATAARYRDYYAAQDLWVQRLAAMSTGTVVRASSLVPHEQLARTEFYNDFVVPMGNGPICALVVENSTDFVAFSSIVRTRNRADFGQTEINLATVLVPHMRRAFAVFRKLADSSAEVRAHQEMLDQTAEAMVLLDGSGCVLRMNARAASIFARGDGMRVQGGRVESIDPRDNALLARLVEAASRTGAGRGLANGGLVPIRRRGTGTPYSVLVTPLRATSHQLGQRCACAALIIGDAQAPRSCRSHLMRMYGLTAAEARVAEALAAGTTLQETAERFGVAVHTARSQLKAIFAKIGVRRQAELVRVVLSLPRGVKS